MEPRYERAPGPPHAFAITATATSSSQGADSVSIAEEGAFAWSFGGLSSEHVITCRKQPGVDEALWCKSCRFKLSKRCYGLQPTSCAKGSATSSSPSSSTTERSAPAISDILSEVKEASATACSVRRRVDEDDGHGAAALDYTGSSSPPKKKRINEPVVTPVPQNVLSIDEPCQATNFSQATILPLETAVAIDRSLGGNGGVCGQAFATPREQSKSAEGVGRASDGKKKNRGSSGVPPKGIGSSRRIERAAAVAAPGGMTSPQPQITHRLDSLLATPVAKRKATLKPRQLEQQWVQCGACSKWRSVPGDVTVSRLPKMWSVLFSAAL